MSIVQYLIDHKNNIIKISFTILAITLSFLHLLKILVLDNITIGLFIISFTPWLLPHIHKYIKSGEIFGTKFELLQDKVSDQEKQIQAQQEDYNRQQTIINKLVIYSLGESPYIMLWKLSKEPFVAFEKNSTTFIRWMNILLDHGLIQSKNTSRLIFNFDDVQQGENLVNIVKPTPAGEFLIDLRKAPQEI